MKMLSYILSFVLLIALAAPVSAKEKNTPQKIAPAATMTKQGNPQKPVHFPLEQQTTADGALTLILPGRAEQASVIPIQIISQQPANTAIIVWNEQELHVEMPPFSHGKSTLKALLPVPIDAAAATPFPLMVRVGENSLQTTINVQAVDWPTQNLSVDNAYVTPPKALDERLARERDIVKEALESVQAAPLWSTPFTRPVLGKVTSSFGGKRLYNGKLRSIHRGVDLRGAVGNLIKSMAKGRVLLAVNHHFSGNMVMIDHGQGLVSIYAHLDSIAVRQKDIVEAGSIIGKVGATGRVTGPHLHFGVLLHGQAVNPLALLGARF